MAEMNVTYFDMNEVTKLLFSEHKSLTEILVKLKELPGKSFIFNLERLIKTKTCSDKHKLEYLYLASLRNEADYIIYDDLSLNILFTNLSEEHLLDNPLLKLNNGKIIFTLETTSGN